MKPKNLFLIDGAAGAGKSDLISFVDSYLKDKNTSILIKFTTRKHREAEILVGKPLDLEFIDDQEFDERVNAEFCYQYKYPHKGISKRYGFFKSALERELTLFNNVFVIVRCVPTILDIINDLPDINVIPIFVYTLPQYIERRLETDGYSEEEIKLRVTRSEEALAEYYSHPLLYKHVFINNSEEEVYRSQFRQIFDHYNAPKPELLRISAREHYLLPSHIRQHKDAMVTNLEKYSFERNLFIMMRFGFSPDHLFDLIKLSVDSFPKGFRAIRADMHEWLITKDDVTTPYAVLYCCKYGIAVFNKGTETSLQFNTNIAIELAVMRNLGRRCLVLIEDGVGPIPFNLEGFQTKYYKNTEEIPDIIIKWLRAL